MPIAPLVEAHHRLEYANSVTMVAQQLKNPLSDTVTTVAAKGEAMSATDALNAVEYVYGEERSRRNVENPISGYRRWLIRPPEIKSGQYIDDEDKFDMSRDPTSDFVRAHTVAVMRGAMDRIVGVRKAAGAYTVTDGGILGNAIEGKRPGGAATALPAGQIVPVGGTGLTLDKLRASILTLNQADFGLEDDDPLYCLISPKQKDDLLAIAQASATPLNAFAIDQLKNGKPTPLMGVTWIISNRVPKDAAGNWVCPIWSKRNVVEGVWEEINGDMWNDTSADNKPYVRVRTRRDVVRLQDKGVIAITCLA
jgi:Phage capsid protein